MPSPGLAGKSASVSRPEEREANHRTIRGSQMTLVRSAGHFLSLNAPEALDELVLNFGQAK